VREVQGVMQGFVSDTLDPEQLGRVKLRMPTLDQDYVSGWAFVASPMSGPSRGFFYSPEVGDEVLVAFEHGNIDHPYVIGYLYNGRQKPPESELTNRVILTPGGNTLRFEDKDGEKKIVLRTSAGMVLEMDEKGQKVTLSDAGGETITLSVKDGQILIDAGSKAIVNAPKIELVQGSTEPVILGNILSNYLDNILNTALVTHLHAGQMCLGILPVTPAPPSTPIPPATAVIKSQRVTTG
jgi:uncharacterized protein involved in type VI secretion and phage assembly